jgi:hypothetical protein
MKQYTFKCSSRLHQSQNAFSLLQNNLTDPLCYIVGKMGIKGTTYDIAIKDKTE